MPWGRLKWQKICFLFVKVKLWWKLSRVIKIESKNMTFWRLLSNGGGDLMVKLKLFWEAFWKKKKFLNKKKMLFGRLKVIYDFIGFLLDTDWSFHRSIKLCAQFKVRFWNKKWHLKLLIWKKLFFWNTKWIILCQAFNLKLIQMSLKSLYFDRRTNL